MSKVLTLLLGAALAWAGATSARAQESESMRAVPLEAGEVIRLDGRLDHPAWQRAPVFSRFVEKVPVAGGPPPQETQVRILYDRRALYVGVSARDRTAGLHRLS